MQFVVFKRARVEGTALAGAVAASSNADQGEPPQDIFSALQSQIGLRLESRKASVEVIVIDHVERRPAGN
jgi:uncharacterized protein (TIGR03435 family)